jgi:hypothetical protein
MLQSEHGGELWVFHARQFTCSGRHRQEQEKKREQLHWRPDLDLIHAEGIGMSDWLVALTGRPLRS